MVDRTDQLWAIHEIRQLAYKYAYACDTRDFDLMLSLWVPTDIPAVLPDIDIHRMRDLNARLADVGASTFFIGNHLIELDGEDRAHGSVYCMVYVDQGNFLEQAIIYQDHYERHQGKWLFLKRAHLLWWGQERTPNPMQQPPANWPMSQIGAGNAASVIRKS